MSDPTTTGGISSAVTNFVWEVCKYLIGGMVTVAVWIKADTKERASYVKREELDQFARKDHIDDKLDGIQHSIDKLDNRIFEILDKRK